MIIALRKPGTKYGHDMKLEFVIGHFRNMQSVAEIV
jgi:hypothetical protein